MSAKKQIRKPHSSMRKSNNLLNEKLVYSGTSDEKTSIRITCYDKTSLLTTTVGSVKELQSSMDKNKVNWIHIIGLKNEELIGELCAAFGLPFPAIQDILNVNHISKIEEFNDVLLVILDAYAYNDTMDLNREHLSLVLGTNFVLSFEETTINRFEVVNTALDSNIGQARLKKSDYLFNLLISIVVDSYLEVVEIQQDSLMEMEDSLIEFNVVQKESGPAIQRFRKDYSKLKKSISPLREHFGQLITTESGLISNENLIFFRDTNDHLQQVSQMIDANRETIASLVDLYLANNDLRMNQIMKQLTVVSTIFIPLTFLVGVWGMNFRYMPELEWVNGYWYAWLLMLILGIFFYFWLRRKNMF